MRTLIATALLLWSARALAAGDGCKHVVLAREVSPDRVRQAVTDETICAAGPYASDVTATVRVGPAASSGGIAVLGVDTGGHAEDRPRLAWSGTDALDVTVPNLSFLRVLELHPGKIRVHLHFNPADPAARKAWLNAHTLDPD